jgi:putative membrane fusion protein
MKKQRPLTVIPGKGKKKRRRENIGYILLLLAAAALVLQAAYSFARDALAGMLVRTVISEDTVLEQLIVAGGVIVREETVIAAPVTGTVRWVAEPGERLSVGSRAAVITAENGMQRNIYVPASGVMVPELDGLEGLLHPKALESIDLKEIRRMRQKILATAEGEEVRQGTILLKVVNNYIWYFVSDIPVDELELLADRKTVPLRFDFAPDVEVSATWSELERDERLARVVFEIREEVAGCFTRRLAEAEVVARRTRGLILPETALLERGEDTGVYILDKAVVRFRPVEVLDYDGDTVVVSGVPHGFTVITNPRLVKEGQRL